MIDLETIDKKDFNKLLIQSAIDTSKEVLKPPTILSIKEIGTTVKTKRLFTLGNFSAVIGKMKAKKTFLISLFAAAIKNGEDYNKRFIGSLPENKKLIVYIDTEQSEYDSYNCIKRIEKMAGSKDNFFAFNWRPFSPKERVELLEFIFEKYKEHLALVIIDGIADLVSAINDENEATKIVTILLKYTALYNCHILTVIHQNKLNEFATGHIGSAIMKKSEIIISVTKCKKDKDSSDVQCDYSRGQGFEPFVLTINEHGYPYVDGERQAEKHKPFYDITESKNSNSDEDLPF